MVFKGTAPSLFVHYMVEHHMHHYRVHDDPAHIENAAGFKDLARYGTVQFRTVHKPHYIVEVEVIFPSDEVTHGHGQDMKISGHHLGGIGEG